MSLRTSSSFFCASFDFLSPSMAFAFSACSCFSRFCLSVCNRRAGTCVRDTHTMSLVWGNLD
ncbi:hypothetical protein DPMN_179592 [Dreissena polymorpha]|uniref:Uncharacterized protein n=1 Tax=Dreissena polymorpha TaxID=45954 RepID=A0A9D4EFD9_DREPO|nr:hypothetical protein DPMN_179592 [Dreissena polymorpha]